jgi:hypothetical protein
MLLTPEEEISEKEAEGWIGWQRKPERRAFHGRASRQISTCKL